MVLYHITHGKSSVRWKKGECNMKKTRISNGWKFCEPGKPAVTVDIPHDYAIHGERRADAPGGGSVGYFTGSCGTYSKYIKLGGDAHTILDIDGAYMCARVYFNEDLLTMHPYGYSPFLVDLSGKVRAERNNKIVIHTLGLQPSSRWYSGAGLYRDVSLWTGGSVRIEPWDMYVTTDEISEDGGKAVIRIRFCVSAELECKAEVSFTVRSADGEKILVKSVSLDAAKGKNNSECTAQLDSPLLWSAETPHLYKLEAEVSVGGEVTDTADCTFGVRTVAADAKLGLTVNGKTVKLKGGCIHHDHAVLGSAEYPAAIRRKLTLLKNAGFNSVRCAHNPPSSAFLEVCDEIGLYVMDEMYDMWNTPKNNLDYSLWFADHWQRDIEETIKRDRSHASVISYSTGNEIPERDGTSDGFAWSARLADEIRKYDSTRLVTSAVCGIWAYPEADAPDDYKKDFFKGCHDAGDGGPDTTWGERTEDYMKPRHIVGYNYLYKRCDGDRVKYPDRVIWHSETMAVKFYDSWKTVEENANVIGDYTWTAFDNLGEVGTGRFMWGRDGYVAPGANVAEYPWRSCYQGDLDLCGYRRPQSYFREAIWNKHAAPHIFTTHPEHNGDIFSGTCWHWYDVWESWTFPVEYIGTPVKTEVYTTADEVVFTLNGREVGRAAPVRGIASADIPYEPGTLSASVLLDGETVGTAELSTVSDAYKVKITPEADSFTADGRDLCYFDISVTDREGRLVTDAENALECRVIGGELLGIYSGNPANEDVYGSCKCHAFGGRALAVVKSKIPGTLTLYVKGENLCGDVAYVRKVR